MDALILNAGHSQLEEQLKIAAACGIAERQNGMKPERCDITTVMTTEDNSDDIMIAVAEDNHSGLHDIIIFNARHVIFFPFLNNS
ncbi:unnamed protein product [Thelazia callipaeda]|uniref:Uncharacterized protein n=1 Tax=Thelazia callipaeda TaxID=103827 RepID=A0A0N5D619_THECL|nr:unnamed protein product [Thelazia callipaeda]